jgi:hypothetical protein
MGRDRNGELAAARQRDAQLAEGAPPSEEGDVEDAVAPEVGGELTRWMPPGQSAEESDQTKAGLSGAPSSPGEGA